MSVEFAATILSGEIFFGIVFALYLYKSGQKLRLWKYGVEIVDRD